MIGTTLAHFKVTAKLGEGGMGEVYRATDTKLDREVAIKALPAAMGQDPKRLARFEREAKVLASLSHPNIAGIYGLEESGGLQFLALELVEGDNLAELLERGGIEVDKALELARQMASGIEAAHDQGIVHRDLKPANVMVTPDGQVKILDFGLAKAWGPQPVGDGLSHSPTLTAEMTQAGTILGTAPYMAPEQAKGEALDRRADIWAFGVVLWEMLTGRRLFSGKSVSEVLAAVLMSDVDFSVLPRQTPASICRLLERCLRRDHSARLKDIGDARIVLEESVVAPDRQVVEEEAGPPRRALRVAGGAGLVVLGLALGAALSYLWQGEQAPSPSPVTRVAVPIGQTLRVFHTPLLTPDGRTVVFRAVDVDPAASDHRPRLYIRRLDSDELVEVAGSTGALAEALSPDGRWLAFVAPISDRSSRNQLLKVPVDQSAMPLKIADWPEQAPALATNEVEVVGLVWPNESTIVSLRDRDWAVLRFSAEGGPASPPVRVSSDRQMVELVIRSVLPGGRHLLTGFSSLESGVYRRDVGLLDSQTGELRRLLEDANRPWYASSGHLTFSRRDVLLAVPFDLERLEVVGGAQPVVDGLWAEGMWGGGPFSLSKSGDLLYAAGGVQRTSRWLATVSRDGRAAAWSEDRLEFLNVWTSPDGRRLAVKVDNIGAGDALLQVRVSDLDRPRLVTVGTQPGKDCGRATWSTDSRELAYLCWDQETTSLYVTQAHQAGPSEVLYEESRPATLRMVGFSEENASVLVHREDGAGSAELVSVPRLRELRPVRDSNARVIPMKESDWSSASTSPDGRWLAYLSLEAGRKELFVRQILDAGSLGPRVLAATGPATLAWWSSVSSEGQYELLMRQFEELYSIDVVTGTTLRFSEPQKIAIDWFALGTQGVDSLPDGRFVIVRGPDTEHGASELRLVMNWTQELAQKFE